MPLRRKEFKLIGQESPLVSVLIPVRNRRGFLSRLLESIRKSDLSLDLYEVIVVDDASNDNLADICRDSGARHIRLEERSGPARARNQGAQVARGCYLLFIDSDVIIPVNLISSALRYFELFRDIAAVTFFSQSYCPEDSSISNFGAVYEHYYFSKLRKASTDNRLIHGFAARCGMIRREIFRKIGGFDERFRTNAMEEYDLSIRLGRNHVTVLTDQPSIYHSFTDSFMTINRNYFVRTKLFIRYWHQSRHRLDDSQVSIIEMYRRLLACASGFAWLSVPLIIKGPAILMVLPFLLSAGYVGSMAGFIAHASACSHRKSFGITALFLHFLTAFSILAGAVAGMLTLNGIPGLADREAGSDQIEGDHRK